ncbi:hypothetical protein L1887_18306 [Cichorium endivia]|nr:hypothetical protein L1887_18306 [Cichorium endivia]
MGGSNNRVIFYGAGILLKERWSLELVYLAILLKKRQRFLVRISRLHTCLMPSLQLGLIGGRGPKYLLLLRDQVVHPLRRHCS